MNERKVYRLFWNEEEKSDRLLMSDEGARLIKWLVQNDYLAPGVSVECEEKTKINEI